MGRLVAITGVTRGLGRAMAEGFIERGHTVAGCGRSKAAIAELRGRFGDPHDFEVVDVTDDRAVEKWAGAVLKKTGPPDLLINNAAVINRNAPLWKVPAEEFSTVIDVNIKGVATVLRHFIPPMIARGTGIIVNFSSGWGRATDAEVAPYCATKWAIEGLTQSLAQELPGGMAAVAVNPGIIDTVMLRSCFGGSAAGFPKPEEWAERAVPFLLSITPENVARKITVS